MRASSTHPPPTRRPPRQLDSDDVGQVSGPKEHPLERRTQVTQTPVREERVIEHTRQRSGVRKRLTMPRIGNTWHSSAGVRAGGGSGAASVVGPVVAGLVGLEIVRLRDGQYPPPGLDQLVFYLPDAAAQEQVMARLAVILEAAKAVA
jgi:hypothetical protein